MTTMYTQIVLPQATQGFVWSGNAPAGVENYGSLLTSTQTLNGAIFPPNWDPTSTNAAARTIYVPDTAGTLSLEQAQLDCYGLSTLQTQQINTLKASWSSALTQIPVTLNGTSYTLDNSDAKQVYNLNLSASAQTIMAQSPNWTASTSVNAGSYMNIGGVYVFATTSGETGTTEPTAPTTFGTTVTDGTVTWALLGRHVFLTNGTTLLITPQQIMNLSTQAEMYIHEMTSKLDTLVTQVNAATTVADIDAVTW